MFGCHYRSAGRRWTDVALEDFGSPRLYSSFRQCWLCFQYCRPFGPTPNFVSPNAGDVAAGVAVAAFVDVVAAGVAVAFAAAVGDAVAAAAGWVASWWQLGHVNDVPQ